MRISKRSARILTVVAIVLAILAVVSNVVLGMDPSGFKANESARCASNLKSILNAGIGIAQIIGVGVAIVMLIVLAIKYISAAPGDKAEIKKHAVVYVVGAIILFAASGILGIIKSLSENVK